MQWINRDPSNNALVVFLHGIFGRFWHTWGDFPQRLQSRRDPTVRSYDIYLFDYRTSLLQQPSLLEEPLARLDSFLGSVSWKYDTIVLIAHSQGGLLAKLYVIEKLLTAKGLDLKVDLIIACHTPHLGIALCNIPLSVRAIPLIGRFVRCDQLCDLGSWSPVIRKLKKHWGPPLIHNMPCKPGPSHRFIRSITLATREQMVWTRSARGFPVDVFEQRGEKGHLMSIDELDHLFREYLEHHGSPGVLLREIRRIQEHPTDRSRFLSNTHPLVRSLVQRTFPSFGTSQISASVDLLTDAFLMEFPHHPLRNVPTIEEALMKYVDRKLAVVRGSFVEAGVP